MVAHSHWQVYVWTKISRIWGVTSPAPICSALSHPRHAQKPAKQTQGQLTDTGWKRETASTVGALNISYGHSKGKMLLRSSWCPFPKPARICHHPSAATRTSQTYCCTGRQASAPAGCHIPQTGIQTNSLKTRCVIATRKQDVIS